MMRHARTTDQFPDSAIARQAEALLRSTSRPALVNHCLRSYRWGVELARIEKIAFDPEVLFVAAALHDVGLEHRFDTGVAFEDDGGRVVQELAWDHGWTAVRVHAVREAVERHIAPMITLDLGPEAYLLWNATGLDVSGHRLDEVAGPVAARVLAEHPWLDFTDHFRDLFLLQAQVKPWSRARELVDAGLLDRLAASPLSHSHTADSATGVNQT